MKKISTKRLQAIYLYGLIRDRLSNIIKTTKIRCYYCDQELRHSFDIHHLGGREEGLLTKEEDMICVHRNCHRILHDVSRNTIYNTKEYKMYLVKLKNEHKEFYLNEMHKLYKCGIITIEEYNNL